MIWITGCLWIGLSGRVSGASLPGFGGTGSEKGVAAHFINASNVRGGNRCARLLSLFEGSEGQRERFYSAAALDDGETNPLRCSSLLFLLCQGLTGFCFCHVVFLFYTNLFTRVVFVSRIERTRMILSLFYLFFPPRCFQPSFFSLFRRVPNKSRLSLDRLNN